MIKPLGNRILAEAIPHIASRETPIVLPERYAPDAIVFRVVAVGSGKLRPDGTREPIPIEAGWRVVSHAVNAPTLEWEGRKLRVLDVATVELVLPP